MSHALTPAAPTEFLSVEEQRELIAAAQDVPVSTTEDGRRVYGKTAASEAALEKLTLAFMPAIEKAGRSSAVVDSDEGASVALLAFLEAVRDYDLDSDLPFTAYLPRVLRFAVLRFGRESDVVRVKHTVAAAYWSLMYRHGEDFGAAYAEVKLGVADMTPATFLAAHHVMAGIDSLDPVLRAEEDGSTAYALAASVSSHEERVATEAEVAWLFTKVSPLQESALRLAYGFTDRPTETIRVTHGFRIGEELSDGQIAHVLEISRPKAQRERTKALGVMREALELEE